MYWMRSTQSEKQPAVASTKGLIRRRGLLLIDDDESFRALFRAIAASHGIPAEAYGSLADLPSFAALRDYDCIVLDYYLESFKGPEIAEYVDVFFNDLPVLVISGGDVLDHERRAWPACIRRFIPKAFGPYAIIESALAALADRPVSLRTVALN